MALSTLRRVTQHDTAAPPHDTAAAARADAGTRAPAAPGTGSGRTERAEGARTGRARPRGDADGMAVASFVLGLPGLLVGNLFLGPVAIVLALLALAHGTGRRGRAFLGLGLGVADLVVLAALVMADHTVSWGLTG